MITQSRKLNFCNGRRAEFWFLTHQKDCLDQKSRREIVYSAQMLRRSKRKRDTTGVSSEIGSLNPAADDVKGPGHTIGSAACASQQFPTSGRIERCRLLGKARSKQAQQAARMAPSGATGSAVKKEQLAVERSSTTPCVCDTFEEVHGCVISGVLPRANALLAAEHDKWALQRDANG